VAAAQETAKKLEEANHKVEEEAKESGAGGSIFKGPLALAAKRARDEEKAKQEREEQVPKP
jgi:hypothetical protein